ISQTIPPGKSASYSIRIQSLGNFTQAVNLSAAVVPNDPNLTVNLSSMSAQPGNNATLTVTTDASTMPAMFAVVVTGSAGSITHTATVTVNVINGDFALTLSPAKQSIAPGDTVMLKLSSSVINNFAQMVNLQVAVAPQDGSVNASIDAT